MNIKIPQQSILAIVIAILKPGKSVDDLTKYRPISLPGITYKFLERLIYNRIQLH